ncbi:hypothetical protein NDU88_001409 [Pleurodeles waltl]|uniref:Uncharacterized protein n=1 Tax=Pleurodeles waltl TaxID=8319 RepID=A0AAV7NDC2_PLEWA|nr:hypothetical protein NDU88_001409 [Pleurodeles waltl]
MRRLPARVSRVLCPPSRPRSAGAASAWGTGGGRGAASRQTDYICAEAAHESCAPVGSGPSHAWTRL